MQDVMCFASSADTKPMISCVLLQVLISV